jgi:hypothetical protein
MASASDDVNSETSTEAERSCRRSFRFDRRSSNDLDRTESGMSCEAGAENRGIVVRPCVDTEVDGRPSLHINHHPEFDHPQSKALHIGQKLGRRGKRIRGNGPEDDGRSATCGGRHLLISSAGTVSPGQQVNFPLFYAIFDFCRRIICSCGGTR